MSEWKFSRNHVPAFIYLIDQIIKDDFYKDEENMYEKIAAEGALNKKSIHQRTIQRAFELREQLKQDAQLTIKKVHRPSLNTLNVITKFYFDGTPDKFLKFETAYAEDIMSHYVKVQPTDKVLAVIFKEVPSKIALLEEHISGLEALLDDLKNTSLTVFVKDITEARLAKAIAGTGHDEVRTSLEHFIEERIAISEKKLKRASLLYRFLGGFGLLFVTTPQYSDIRAYVFNAFVDNHEDDFDLTDDDDDGIDGDLLDAAL